MSDFVLTYPQAEVLVDMPTEPPGIRRSNPPWVAMARKLVRMGLAQRSSAPELFWRTEAGTTAVRSRKRRR